MSKIQEIDTVKFNIQLIILISCHLKIIELQKLKGTIKVMNAKNLLKAFNSILKLMRANFSFMTSCY